MKMPDGKCPRCREIRPRDGHIGHVTQDGQYCTTMDGRHVYFDAPPEHLRYWG